MVAWWRAAVGCACAVAVKAFETTPVGDVESGLKYDQAARMYWKKPVVIGEEPESAVTRRVALEYCEELDLLVLAGGARYNMSMVPYVYEGVNVYDFADNTVYQVIGEGDDFPARSEAHLVPVAARRQGTCRFLYWGGSEFGQGERLASVLLNTPQVYQLELERDPNSGLVVATSSEVEIQGDPLPGRVGGAVVGYGNKVYVYGGFQASSSPSTPCAYRCSNEPWCVKLPGCVIQSTAYELTLDDSDTSNSTTKATWRLLFDMSTAEGTTWAGHIAMSTAVSKNGLWLVYGGLVTSDNGLTRMKGDILTLDLKSPNQAQRFSLSKPHLGESCESSYSADCQLRAYHSSVVVGDKFLSLFGTTLQDRSWRYVNPFISTTTFQDQLASGSSAFACNAGGGTFNWCGFPAEYPGRAISPSVAVRKNSVYVVSSYLMEFQQGSVRFDDANLTLLWELNVSAMYDSGMLQDFTILEGQKGVDPASTVFLQYSLLAVCMMLLTSLMLLLRARNYRGQNFVFILQPKKNRGVTKEVVRGLDYVMFDKDGKHRRVKLEWPQPPKQESQNTASGDTQAALPAPQEALQEEEPRIVEKIEEDESCQAVDWDSYESYEQAVSAVLEKLGLEGCKTEFLDKFSSREEIQNTMSSGSLRSVGVNKFSDQQNALRAFGIGHASSDSGELCAICIVDFEQDDLLQRLPCGHLFHWDCTEPWLLKNGTCPQCRHHVVTGEEIDVKASRASELVSSTEQVTSAATESVTVTVPNLASDVTDSPSLVAARRASQRASQRVAERASRRASQRASRRTSQRVSTREASLGPESQRSSRSRASVRVPGAEASSSGPETPSLVSSLHRSLRRSLAGASREVPLTVVPHANQDQTQVELVQAKPEVQVHDTDGRRVSM